MKSKKRLAIAATVVLILAIAAVCIFAVCGGDEPVPEAATSAPSAAASTKSAATAAQAEETSEPMTATFLPEEAEIIDGVEIDVLPDDEIADEQTLEEQYSDFTDATISLPIVP